MIETPYLLFLGDVEIEIDAKTAFGLRDWARDSCLGQFRLSPTAVDLGLPDMTPSEAVAAGAKTLVCGIAPTGGAIPHRWLDALVAALEAGLDLAAGLHDKLNATSRLAEAAKRLGRKLHDVRVPAPRYPVGTGRKRQGLRLLTVGTDCALGKKYTALTLTRELNARGRRAVFRATGQTGILISGEGVPLDAVVSDFLSGAAETLSPETAPDLWQIIEGQGSLFHPGFAAVTLGLVHGSQPDAMVLCHDPTRRTIEDCPGFLIPDLAEAMDLYLRVARLTNPSTRFVGLAFNTSKLDADASQRVLAEAETRHGLPAVDPIRTGVDAIADFMENQSWT